MQDFTHEMMMMMKTTNIAECLWQALLSMVYMHLT